MEAYVSWSITVNDVQEMEGFPVETVELFASLHPSYPRDSQVALDSARAAGLKSATLSGGRTPNPYGGDEIVDISVRGTPVYKDFLSEMREIIRSGPGEDSSLARHYSALAILRGHPCSHVFEETDRPGVRQCLACKVFLNGTMFYFEGI
jgi:hypothetical protein